MKGNNRRQRQQAPFLQPKASGRNVPADHLYADGHRQKKCDVMGPRLQPPPESKAMPQKWGSVFLAIIRARVYPGIENPIDVNPGQNPYHGQPHRCVHSIESSGSLNPLKSLPPGCSVPAGSAFYNVKPTRIPTGTKASDRPPPNPPQARCLTGANPVLTP